MYNKNMTYLSFSSSQDCVPKTAHNLSKLNQLSLKLCEVIVKNAHNTDAIFYAITDIKKVQRMVRNSNEYQKILASSNEISKKNLIKSLLSTNTLCILDFDNSESEIVEILIKDLCN